MSKRGPVERLEARERARRRKPRKATRKPKGVRAKELEDKRRKGAKKAERRGAAE